jgi:type I restriction enzyme S subunit
VSNSKLPVVKLAEVLKSEDLRLDASYYASEAYEAERILLESGYPLEPMKKLAERIFNLPRFRRVWVQDPKHGYPYLSPTEVLYFKPLRERFISKRKKDASKFFVKEGWILLTCSGAVGIPVYVTEPLTKYFLSHDIIRIVPKEGVYPGYLYAYLSTKIAKALIMRQEYGMTVPHIEPEHVESLPVPRLPNELEKKIHEKIVMAWQKRVEASKLEEEAIRELEELLTQPLVKRKDAITPSSTAEEKAS